MWRNRNTENEEEDWIIGRRGGMLQHRLGSGLFMAAEISLSVLPSLCVLSSFRSSSPWLTALIYLASPHVHKLHVMNIHLFVCLNLILSLFILLLLRQSLWKTQCVCVCVCARVRVCVCACACSQFHAFLRMSGSDSISRKRTVVLRPRISQLLLVCVRVHARWRVRSSVCVHVCV